MNNITGDSSKLELNSVEYPCRSYAALRTTFIGSETGYWTKFGNESYVHRILALTKYSLHCLTCWKYRASPVYATCYMQFDLQSVPWPFSILIQIYYCLLVIISRAIISQPSWFMINYRYSFPIELYVCSHWPFIDNELQLFSPYCFNFFSFV